MLPEDEKILRKYTPNPKRDKMKKRDKPTIRSARRNKEIERRILEQQFQDDYMLVR